jgi:hypothetical protein
MTPNATTADTATDNTQDQPARKVLAAPTVLGGLPVVIPDTEVTIIFPLEYAFALGTGAFTAGIKLLEDNIKAIQAANTDEQPTDSSQE